MALDFLRLGDCAFYGPALPEPYVRFELEKALIKHKLLPDVDGLTGRQAFRDEWDVFRRKLRDVSPNSGPLAITNRILEPLVSRLGYAKLAPADAVLTREGDEAGGVLLSTDAGTKLRCWAIDYDADLDAPTQRGYAYRFSPVRIAQRVLLATGERVGLITNGVGLRLLLCDPTRPESHIEIDLNVWRLSRDLPDGYQLLLALAGPAGIAALPEIIEDARLKQNKVTKELRVQARRAVEEFVQSVLDHPDNTNALAGYADKGVLAKALWHEGLIVVYRLLFVLKCESTSDPSRVFRFASTPLWRNTYSPSTALARTVRQVLDEGATSGRYLEDGMRVLFTLFAEGLEHPGLNVRPLGGVLFGAQSTPLLSSLRWGELAVAHLLDRLLWSDTRRGRERVHYGPLDVEDLGRVYEALLELEPGIATEPMCRLRRQKLEVVVSAGQGAKYRAAAPAPAEVTDEADDGDDDQSEETAEDDKPVRGKKTKVEWIEAIAPERFYLRVGLGRKSSGSYYTPHSFVRFLVQETLGPQCDERSPRDNPDPGAILKLKVLDPACGSGHFLVEACRFLAGRVYEAARLCDELASKAEHDAEAEKNAARKQGLLERVDELRQRLRDLPDQEDELLSYLPSRSAGADKAVLSAHDIARAEAICRRLVAVHCIYGVDINPLAVELAKLSLWIESHAEGFPLTFLDHRIVVGNSLTGPFWEKLMFAPGSQESVSDWFRQNLDLKLTARLQEALTLVRHLEASVGVDVEDIAAKEKLKREIDARLQPFRVLAAAWSGGVMLGTDQPDGAPRCDDAAYSELLEQVGNTGEMPTSFDSPNLQAMIDKGRLALPYDLTFPEVFHPTGLPHGRHGFDGVVGNPPWDAIQFKSREFLGSFDIEILNTNSKKERSAREKSLLAEPYIAELFKQYQEQFEEQKRIVDALYVHQKVHVDGDLAGRQVDAFRVFLERSYQSLRTEGFLGQVLPAALCGAAGGVGVRRLLLNLAQIQHCYTFQNKKKIFDIVTNVKFTVLVVRRQTKGTDSFPVAFYILDDEWLFAGPDRPGLLKYDAELVRATGGSFTTLIELKSQSEVNIAAACSSGGLLAGEVLRQFGMKLGAECHMTNDFERFEPVATAVHNCDPRDPEALASLWRSGSLLLSDEDSIHQYDDHWTERPSYVVPINRVQDRPDWLRPARYYRLFVRRIATVVDRRSFMCAVVPAGWLTGSPHANKRSGEHAHSSDLSVLALLNSFCADWNLRLRLTATVSLFILDSVPLPKYVNHQFVAHSALRLTCNHAGYEPLWREQLGNTWREPSKAPFTWPVVVGDNEHWAVRAAIDAVVADAYGLSREQYAHVLSTFSHASYKKAPELCLAAFDELKAIGLDAFCKKHDPYHDVPLVETLPKPVIDLPIPVESDGAGAGSSPGRRRKSRPDQPLMWQDETGELRTEVRKTPSGTDPGKVLAAKTLLELQKVLSSAELQKKLGYEPVEASAILKSLVKQNLAVVDGKGRGTRYRWREQ